MSQDVNDGQFWIKFDDYIKFFDITSICYVSEKNQNTTFLTESK